MLKDFKSKLQDLDFQRYFAWFKPQNIPFATLNIFRGHLRSIEPNDLKELKIWLVNAQNIQTDSILTKKEKLDMLKVLPTSSVIMDFLKSSIITLAADGPIKDRLTLKKIVDGAGLFTAGFNLRVAGALFIIRWALPYFLRSDIGTKFIGFIKSEMDNLDSQNQIE